MKEGRPSHREEAGGIPPAARVLLGMVPFLAILGLWTWAAGRTGSVVPGPGRVLQVLAHPFRPPPNLDSLSLAESALVSLLRVAAGFFLALVTAVPMGILVGRSPFFRVLLGPLVEAGRPICPVAWLPLTILIFGFSSAGTLLFGEGGWKHDLLDQLQLAMAAVIWWGAFFPIFVNTVHGVRSARRLYVETALSMGASRAQVLRIVVLPAALPSITAGLRIGFGTAWMVIVAAEFFPGTKAGLGYLITTAHQLGQYEYAFASIIVIAFIGIAANSFLLRLEERVGRWRARER